MHSMTGFGRGVAPYGQGHVIIEMRTVNHRFLETRSRAPRELMAAESLLDRLVREHLFRGYCTINLWYEGAKGGTTVLDKGALSSHLANLVEVGKEMNLKLLAELTPLLAGAPNLFAAPKVEDETAFESSIGKAFKIAVDKLLEMRLNEGEAMNNEICKHLDEVRLATAKLDEHADTHAKTALPKLLERINNLLQNTDVNVDNRRVETEAAFLVERADITEEIARLGSHCDQLQTLTKSEGAIGRRLEFLLQEMNRESNTIGAKSSVPAISHIVVNLKSELEKMRELVQNVE